MTISPEMKQRPFAYSDVYRHPVLPAAAFDHETAKIKAEIPAEIATVCKNESNCTIFLNDGTWFTTWSQGSFEHAKDERIVFATSRDEGLTWSAPQTIVPSTPTERNAYGVPFVIPAKDRIYLFFFSCRQDVPWESPEHDAGNLYFVFSDNNGTTWSDRTRIDLPDRDMAIFPGRFHGWVNHPPQIMPEGDVILPIAQCNWLLTRRSWMLNPAEVSVVRCNNILTEQDPKRLTFTLLPEGPRGIRVDVLRHGNNPALQRLLAFHNGTPEQSAFNFQEMTVVPLQDGRWLGVGRTFLGSPGYTVSQDRGRTWTSVEPLCYSPGGKPIPHPMTMCPIARTSDGRIILLFTNNDGSQRGARHVWDGNGRTRNPQWMVVGRQIPGETRNAGLVFGKPMVLAEVDDSGDTNLKTGVAMPQFIERNGRFFVCYCVNKEHILLDEVPRVLIDRLTPDISKI